MTANGNNRDRPDEYTDETEPSITERLEVVLALIVVGPFGLLLAHKMEDPMVFLWGVGTSLLYVGLFGLIKTVSFPTIAVELGIRPHLETAAAHISAANDALVATFQLPVTYVALFAVGLAIVTVGVYRMLTWDREDIIERTNE